MPTFEWNDNKTKEKRRDRREYFFFLGLFLVYSESQGTLYLFQEQVYIGEFANLVYCAIS